MRIDPVNITLHSGIEAILRSPEASDASSELAFLSSVLSETDFLALSSGEESLSVEDEEAFISSFISSPSSFMISCFISGEIAGNVSVSGMRHRKAAHRAELGIAVRSPFQSIGIGSALLEAALDTASSIGFGQVELGVCSGNDRAIRLYRRHGFSEAGRIPDAFKLPDGSFQDEIIMIRRLCRGFWPSPDAVPSWKG